MDYIPFFDATRPEESIKESTKALKKALQRYPKQHALMCFELVQGEGGFYPGQKEFFVALMTLLKENHIAIFDDEVQTFGRLPSLFAYEYFGLQSFVDIVSIGKLSQVCATLFTKEYAPRLGLLSQTFTGSSSSIAAANVILKELSENNYYGPKGKIEKMFHYMENKLKEMQARNPTLVHGPFGMGGMIAFTPYNGDKELVTQFVKELFHAGVMAFVAGNDPTRVRFLPPLGVITTHDIDMAFDIVEKTLLKV